MADTSPPIDVPIARLTVPANPAYLTTVLNAARNLAAQQGLDGRSVERLAFVVEEICANIMEKAYPPDEPGEVDLLLWQRPGKIVFALEDRGLPFDFRSFQQDGPSLTELLGRAHHSEIRYRNLGRLGNRVELIRDLPAPPPLEHVAEQEMARVADAPAAPPDAPLSLRPMKPEDAEGLTRCVYRTYGYTYVHDALYHPAEVRRLLAAGLMVSCVAVSPEGEIVGHIALLREEPAAIVGEAAEAVVDPRYRGHHLFESLKTLLKDTTKALGVVGMYSEAVAVHPYSQKGNLSLGAHETGILLAHIPLTMAFKQIGDGTAQATRQACVLFYLPVGAAPARTVYLPPAHEAMLHRIYPRLGLNRNLQALPSQEPTVPATRSRLDWHVNLEAGVASLRIAAAGDNLVPLVHQRLREFCEHRVDVIYLDVPLSDPAAVARFDALEHLGFFFGGLVPELSGGDVLRLQYLNTEAPDPTQVQLASDFSKAMLDYVLRAQAAAAAEE